MQRITHVVSTLLAVFACCARAVDVATCEQFAAVDLYTETEVTITTADFACDDYTRLTIRTEMVLKSTVGKVTFSNLAFKVYGNGVGSLTIEPDVVFTGISLVEKNGGALKLERRTKAVFQGTAEFIENSILATNLGTRPANGGYQHIEISRKGGAIHNKGKITFEKDATFTGNRNEGEEVGSGPGGAISVHVQGSIYFMGKLTMTDNFADDYFGGAEGGAINNRGDIVVDGEATFTGNIGGRGGAIYQETWATFVLNSFANFTSNTCYDYFGGAVANIGGEFTANAGSLFFDGFAESSGDGGLGGGIYNEDGGVVTLLGSTTFQQNRGNWGGAIFNELEDDRDDDEPAYQTPVITYPDDTIFLDNYAQYCNDIAYDASEDCGM
eukprot:jgi/Undpi1/629/HiC_scaffold_10.g04093.m1